MNTLQRIAENVGIKMKDMGWELSKTFEQSLEKTIKWSLEHQEWLNI